MVPKNRRNRSGIHSATRNVNPAIAEGLIQRPVAPPEWRRLKFVAALIWVVIICICVRLWFLQIVLGPQLAEASVRQQLRKIRTIPPRGIIEDRNGVIIATNRSQFVIAVTPNDIAHNKQTLPRLAKLLSLPLKPLEAKVKETYDGPERYNPLPVVKGADLKTVAQVDERILSLPGVLVTRQPMRYYKDDSLCTPILGVTRPIGPNELRKLAPLGYQGGDYVGIFGLEKYYETYLHGKPGETDVAVDARGRLMRTLGQKPPQPGDTLKLALDMKLQRVAAEALHDTGHPGAAVAINPQTGGVLTMASMPTYNLNDYGKDYNKLASNPDHPLINRVTGSTYPIGSTFKLITASAGFESGTLATSDTYYCPGYLIVAGRKFKCDEVHGDISFFHALGSSCNVYFFHVAQKAGHTAVAQMAQNFGLGQQTGIDLPTDDRGLIPTTAWKRKVLHTIWLPGDTLNMAIGQGYVRVSPMQLVDYVAAVANGGTLYRPHLVDSIINPETGETTVIAPKAVRSLGVDPQYLQDIIQGMELVTQPRGTAPAAAIPGFPYAAKTGTAQVYFHGKEYDNSVFVCFAPIDHPKIAIAVLVERDGYGGIAAAGVARKMLMSYFHLGGTAKSTAPKP